MTCGATEWLLEAGLHCSFSIGTDTMGEIDFLCLQISYGYKKHWSELVYSMDHMQ